MLKLDVLNLEDTSMNILIKKLMKSNKILFLAFFASFFIACTQNDETDTIVGGKDKVKIFLTPEEALSVAFNSNTVLSDEQVMNILNDFTNTQITRRIANSYSFKIQKEDYISLNSNSVTSRAANEVKPEQIKFVEVEVSNSTDNETGYAVVCADQRYPNVLAFIDNGQIEDASKNGGSIMLNLAKGAALSQIKKINHYKDSLEYVTKEKICNFLNKPVSQYTSDLLQYTLTKVEDIAEPRGFEVTPTGTFVAGSGPLTSTFWIQGWPCNEFIKMAPNDSQWNQSQHKQHYPAGCTVVAMAHIAAYYKPSIRITEPGYNRNIDWSTALSVSDLSANSSTTNSATKEVALLMKAIADNCGTTFSESGGSTDSNKARSYMSNIGIYMNDRTSLTYQNIRQSLSDLKLVFATGSAREVSNYSFSNTSSPSSRSEYLSGSHAWVIDGFQLRQRGLTRQELKQYNVYCHCNFGWVNKIGNGWYLFDYSGTISFSIDNWLSTEIYDANLACYPYVRK